MTGTRAPRIVVAGLGGDAGKTMVTLAILLAARERGLEVRGFKKGPDYIDASWIAWASGSPARNLDTFLTGPAEAVRSFARHAVRGQPDGAGAVNVVEGNRGVFDGIDAAGTHSTAVLAKLLDAPVVLVLNARKVTATAAAPVRGCQAMDPALRIAGVVLNQVAGKRHADVAREAIERVCGVPVLGAIPRLDGPGVLPGRHLGLVPPAEHLSTPRAAEALIAIAREHLDLDRVLAAAASAAPMGQVDTTTAADRGAPGIGPEPVTIGYVSDAAFSFYYPENLEALESRGAALVPVSSIAGGPLPPDLDALYIGGGFPETHGAAIAANAAFLGSLRERASDGLPIFAECGGLMLLSASMAWRGGRHAMAGVLPIDIEVLDAPQGHGYVVLSVDRPNAFFPVGLEIRAHEFHYSRISGGLPATACAVLRGEGCGGGRDAIVARRVWAGYAHMHAAGVPAWADGMMRAAREYRAEAGNRL